MKGLAQPFESLHQVQIIPRGSCFYFLWVFACIFPLDPSKYLHSSCGCIFFILCCHGADDAYARIYGYFKRQLARVSVRAAMLVRLRALDVVLGRSPRPESLMDRKEAKRAKATRLAAVDVVSESGIPADRGSFGA